MSETSKRPPSVIVLAGPNGAGKSTAAPTLLRANLDVRQYVNADVIAQGLAGFAPETVAIAAGRIVLKRLAELEAERVSFAFETTLSGKTFLPRIRSLIATGYRFHLAFIWLSSPDLAVARVAKRVQLGGHHIPEETIRRRYRAGLFNLIHLYRPLAHSWRVYDNSVRGRLRPIAGGSELTETLVRRPVEWQQILQEANHDSRAEG